MSEPSSVPGNRSVLGDQVRVLRRRWRLIALIVVLTVAASLAYSLLQSPQYRSTAEVLLAPTTFDVQRGGADISPEEVATQVRVVTSRPVAELVREDLRLTTSPDLLRLVTVEAVGNARVLRITARATNSTDAADLSRSVSDSYLSYRRTNTQRSLSEVAGVLTERQQQIEDRVDRLDEVLAQRPDRGGQLEAERRNLLSQLGQITTQLAGLDITVSGGAGGDVLTPPDSGTLQVAPRPLLNAVLSLLIGLLLGIALAFVRDIFDTVSHDAESIESRLRDVDVDVLSTIPGWKISVRDEDLITVSQPDSRVGQLFQSLVARIRFVAGRTPNAVGHGSVILCTSAEFDEGNTEVAGNLAVAAARAGMVVVLVNADLRAHGEKMHLGQPATPGLADVLTGTSVEDCLVAGPVDGLSLLPAGHQPPNPTELVASARMRATVEKLCDRFDLVILVTSPSAHYADSLELASYVDMSLLIARIGKSRLPYVSAAARRLQEVGASNVSAVIIGGGHRKRRSDRKAHSLGRYRQSRQQGSAATEEHPDAQVSESEPSLHLTSARHSSSSSEDRDSAFPPRQPPTEV